MPDRRADMSVKYAFRAISLEFVLSIVLGVAAAYAFVQVMADNVDQNTLRIQAMEAEQASTKVSLSAMQTDVAVIREQAANAKDDISELKMDTRETREDVRDIMQEILAVRRIVEDQAKP